jgi:hypothetical protein
VAYDIYHEKLMLQVVKQKRFSKYMCFKRKLPCPANTSLVIHKFVKNINLISGQCHYFLGFTFATHKNNCKSVPMSTLEFAGKSFKYPRVKHINLKRLSTTTKLRMQLEVEFLKNTVSK